MSGRLKLEIVDCEFAPSRTKVRVQLRNSGLTHVGLASSRTEDENWQAVVAQATINAVRMYTGFVGTDLRLALGAVRVVHHPVPAVLVSVSAQSQDRDLALVGTASMRDEPQWAVAKAVLQALNRQLERIGASDPQGQPPS